MTTAVDDDDDDDFAVLSPEKIAELVKPSKASSNLLFLPGQTSAVAFVPEYERMLVAG